MGLVLRLLHMEVCSWGVLLLLLLLLLATRNSMWSAATRVGSWGHLVEVCAALGAVTLCLEHILLCLGQLRGECLQLRLVCL
jgi:hypothetical protein